QSAAPYLVAVGRGAVLHHLPAAALVQPQLDVQGAHPAGRRCGAGEPRRLGLAGPGGYERGLLPGSVPDMGTGAWFAARDGRLSRGAFGVGRPVRDPRRPRTDRSGGDLL